MMIDSICFAHHAVVAALYAGMIADTQESGVGPIMGPWRDALSLSAGQVRSNHSDS